MVELSFCWQIYHLSLFIDTICIISNNHEETTVQMLSKQNACFFSLSYCMITQWLYVFMSNNRSVAKHMVMLVEKYNCVVEFVVCYASMTLALPSASHQQSDRFSHLSIV